MSETSSHGSKTMPYVTIPGTSLVSSRLGFGTASVHHVPTASQRLHLLASAFENGMTHFDTAPMYGEGMAERVLGAFLSAGKRDRVTLATKVGFPALRFAEMVPLWMYAKKASDSIWRRIRRPGVCQRRRALAVQDVSESFTRSLRNLRTEAVDILFVHEPSPEETPAIARMADWLLEQKRLGRARYIGLAGNAAACVAVNRRVPGVFDILQVEDSIQGHEADVVVEAGLPLQITYGYLRLSGRGTAGVSAPSTPETVVANAVARNSTGLVLVSTRQVSRVAELAMCLNQPVCD